MYFLINQVVLNTKFTTDKQVQQQTVFETEKHVNYPEVF